jgi:phage anti-repressor protein
MEELIKLTRDGLGSSRVDSARELHAFLGVKSRFADWFKNRVRQYEFVEDRDYVTFSKNLENGGRELDYELTLGMAKELAMVERTEKGKQARQYFIQCEEMLREVYQQALPTQQAANTEQVLLQLVSQSNQLLANQQQQLDRLRADMDLIMAGHKPVRHTPPLPGQQLRIPGVPPASLRPMISRLVLEYCGTSGASTHDTWNYLYKRLFEVYGISVYRLQRIGTESIVDAVERYGHLDKLYSLIMAELNYAEE